MGKRGPKAKDGECGYITERGYRRIMCPIQKRYRMQHVVVWEQCHGPLAPGLQVHHINENKLDNRIENLQALPAIEHKRLHSGCEQRDGVWWKPCRKCSVVEPVDTYYKRKSSISPWCRKCCIENAVKNKRRRKAEARLPPGP